ncbi:tRNA (N6-threonylcarbamoyladenosine(37)-N6)-methyltransferase TrmO [Paenibacillus lautus]|uniref:tRNA (N6-threonylcarbamoyladenosine(37)-N6)-methyltransferase TrmO n=1 Tax=Paenibacillus lautus TaxID=1401 RepID=A0A385TL18_PAELA|nr:tRNA (N6-threonylcarbamoyladenosine(37)-N6)-methyltransferase TrmO [Paenibacillus lautus]AYB44353.1 tRNA (N6-threonylcarbamoyladenosine(37)-N6)-methyltransferase TrmO [Paenibacillus lautus]VTR24453.1 putative methyltransferase, YaeB/AF_0241 family [Actinobacillus pleuropneumoniae]
MYTIKPIAFVENQRTEIQDDNWGEIISIIRLNEDLSEESIKGIEEFSHLEILFYFHKVSDDKIQYEARHPRNNKEWPEVGIFAQRGKNRPNRLGSTIVELVERKQNELIVKGLDAIQETPVIDIKPVMKEFLPKSEVKQPKWSNSLMERYWN